MEHIGIDVHKRESQICILTPEGEMIERRIQSTRQKFSAMFKDRPSGARAPRGDDGERMGGANDRRRWATR